MTDELTYKSSGVDIDANNAWITRIQSALKSTQDHRVISKPRGFTGLFKLTDPAGQPFSNPVLVSCADGVGTKIILGIQTGRSHSLGIDLVAMNVNDLLTGGATPLFILDYIAAHKLTPDTLAPIIEGIADGCREANCALLGGETAEMPDLYKSDGFDLAGFSVGIVDESKIIDGSKTAPGQSIIALPSSGIHSNGFSLVRKLITTANLDLDQHHDALGETLADAVLKPTRIYVKPITNLLATFTANKHITAMAHITGGGLCENIARVINPNCDAVINRNSWPIPPVFNLLQSQGIAENEMYRVFNMGVGFVIVTPEFIAGDIVRHLQDMNEDATIIGQLVRGTGKVGFR